MKHVMIISIFFLLISPTLFAQDVMMRSPAEGTDISGGIVEFTDLKDAQMIAEEGPAVLFFFAKWCPVCRTELKNLQAEKENLGNITIVVVDYDSSAELKKKYGVTYQHTYVQIDKSGESVMSWNGGGMEGLLSRINRIEAD